MFCGQAFCCFLRVADYLNLDRRLFELASIFGVSLFEYPLREFFTFAWVAVQVAFHNRIPKQTLETRNLNEDINALHAKPTVN